MKNVLKIIGKICLFILGGVLLLVLLVIGGLNIAKFVIYSEYYSSKIDLAKNPGLSDGFVCQGIAVDEESGKILVSGYMDDDRPSRIYVTDKDNNSYYVELEYASGKDFTAHSGGIAIVGENAYISSGKKLYAVPLASLWSAKNGDRVSIALTVPVNNKASFVFADGDYVYVGEYNDGGEYLAEHPYDTPDGTYYALICRYSAAELMAYQGEDSPALKPDRVYSIRNRVQGACFTPDGKVVLSTSYGITSTVYYVYNEADAIKSEHIFDGAPVYYLCEAVREVKGPAMGEDLDYSEGKVVTLTESASNKYMFGKLFFANKIVAIEF